MAFKTSAELFGDGGIWGTQVPISLSSPSGPYAATNRGIGFGEQLTSAIANRSHYALGLNDDDLNTRLALFETSGLDAAYRGGASAVPGVGADITLDGKAVNTVSALATMYALDESNAHWRADMTADVAKVGVGFEVRGRGLAGLAHLEQLDSLAQDSVFAGVGLAATLNPGGGLPTTVRITGQSPQVAGVTDLLLEYDFAVVTQGATTRLYVVSGLGGADTDVTVKNVDGTSPTFGADLAATVTLYRSHFGSFNGLSTRTGLRSNLFASGLRATTDAVLDLVGGRSTTDVTMQDTVLRTRRRTSAGALTTALAESSLGRNERSISVDGFKTQALASSNAIQLVERTKVEADALFTDEVNYDTLSWQQGRRGGFVDGGGGRHLRFHTHELLSGVAGTFATADKVDLTGPPSWAPFRTSFLPLGFTVVQVTASSNPAAIGYYLLSGHDAVLDRITLSRLTSLTGPAVSFLGATVTMTFHVLTEGHVQGAFDLLTNPVVLGTLSNVADYAFLNDDLYYHHALRGALVVRDGDLEVWSNFLPSGPEGIKKVFQVVGGSGTPAVNINAELSVADTISSGDTAATGFRHIDPVTGLTATPSVTHVIGFANALPDYFGGSLEWVYFSRTTGSPGPLKSVANGAQVAIPIRLPHNAQLVQVEITVQMGNTTGGGRSTLTTARLYLNDIDVTTTTQIGATATAADNLTVQKLVIANTNTIDTNDDEVFVVVTAGTDGAHVADTLVGVRVTFEDPGPRNF